jgi:predicted RNA binding protein YcfA (HicA-like mRNA interferase family)
MAKITPVDWRTLVRVFELFGCEDRRKTGSHHILICPRAKRAIVIPEYDEIDPDIIKNNLWTAGMTREEYFELVAQV